MREISTEKIKIGEHIIVDGVEYVAEEATECELCAFHNSFRCDALPCDGLIYKRVKKEPIYRPYKDTEEMIADWNERFMVSNIPAFCMPLIWIKEKPPLKGVYLASAFRKEFVLLGELLHNTQKLFDDFTYLDGSPCGKVEE